MEGSTVPALGEGTQWGAEASLEDSSMGRHSQGMGMGSLWGNNYCRVTHRGTAKREGSIAAVSGI
jgi:hypothetical protein